MTFTEKLNFLLSSHNINKAEFSRVSGIPYTTIDGFYKKGSQSIKSSTLQKVSAYFGCTVDYLVMDEIIDPKGTNSSNSSIDTSLTCSERQLIDNFRSLNDEGQEKALGYVSDLKDMDKYIKSHSYGLVEKQA